MAKQQAVSKPVAAPTVSEAEATIARLQEQHAQLIAERQKAEAETGKHAYAAHAIGDLKAAEVLDQIATTIMRLDARIREIDLAIATANRVLLDARQAEAQAAAQHSTFRPRRAERRPMKNLHLPRMMCIPLNRLPRPESAAREARKMAAKSSTRRIINPRNDIGIAD